LNKSLREKNTIENLQSILEKRFLNVDKTNCNLEENIHQCLHTEW